jgi:hypothetical protein
MPIEVDVPWHVLHSRRDRELIAATVPAVVTAFVGLFWYTSTGSDSSTIWACGGVFIVLQLAFACWAATHALSATDLQRVSLWIRAYGPELHRRVRDDLRHSGDAIGSPQLVTYHTTPSRSDLTEMHLQWALQSDYYNKRELNMLRLMHHFMPCFGHEVGAKTCVQYSYVVSLPFFAISEDDIAACTL